MAFDSTPQATEYFASAYALNGGSAASQDDYQTSQNDDIESLRLQASRLEHLLQVMPAGVIVIDGKGIVRQANEQAKALLGEPLEEEVWRSIITRSFKPRADDGHEVSLVDGRRVKLSITPLDNEPGQLIVITDLTETRQLQARVSHMQRLSSLGKMVASLAHQIRTPLSAAMLYASNLTRKGLGEEAQTQFANKLTDRLKELESQVNDMLLFAKSGEEQVVSKISLAELFAAIEGNAQSMIAQALQKLTFSGFDQNVAITGNLTALQGALLNLIHNASQVTPKGECVHVQASVSDQRLHVSVIDKGPGVPEQLKTKIFEPFFTTKTHGTGLGLAVVKSVVSAHSGALNVIDVPEGGACFSVSLSCSANAKTSQTLTHVA
ncbi:PAS domain-containing protein [Alteromonas sp. BL110]|uniref:sensor histidine kinase n=1 Tax=Alteromonas sp. BL110 TaxID=1714845 RepID=UPI000E4F2A0C|nr:ATP-binding protein [Alteromonas sp. BL110]AXT37675.1 PAS domain-containing protein [Alteromonas sp. BL110]RKM80414.1 PAS domain-containing protein [Alteromonas sp. BL110]